MSEPSLTMSPPKEEAWKATAASKATVQVQLHGIMGEDKCTYFPDYPNLFILPESEQLCGYVHAIDEADRLKAQGGDDVVPSGIQPPNIPSRPRAAYLGRSGPRQDLELLRRNLQVEANAAGKMKQMEDEAVERRKEQQEEDARRAKQAQKEKERMLKEVRAQFQKDMDKLQAEIDAGKNREKALQQAVQDEKANAEERLAKQKKKMEEDFKFQLESAMAEKQAEVDKLNAELAEWPDKLAKALEELKKTLQEGFEKQKAELQAQAEKKKAQLLQLLMDEVVAAAPALVERVQDKHDELASAAQ